MNIKDVNIDELKIDDSFVVKWIKKDIISGRHFCYLKIDKRNLTETFDGNEKEMLAFQCHAVGAYANRYAYLTFEKEFADQLVLELIDVRKIKETYEEAEDTTWLLYEFIFAYVKENDNGEKICFANANCIDSIKCDYTPKVLADKISKELPELNDMKVGDVKAIRNDSLKKVIDIIKKGKDDETCKS